MSRLPQPDLGEDDASSAEVPITGLRRVLIVVEDHEAAWAAVTEGLELARTQAADALLVQILPTEVGPVLDASAIAAMSGARLQGGAQDRSDQMLAAAQAAAGKSGVAARVVSVSGVHLGQAVAEVAHQEDCDVIVVASEGQNAVVRLLDGSIIPALITAAAVPVLVCRGTARRHAQRAPRPRRRHPPSGGGARDEGVSATPDARSARSTRPA